MVADVVTAGALAFDVRAVDVGVARAGELVDEIGVKTMLTQPVAARRQRSPAGDEAAGTRAAVLME